MFQLQKAYDDFYNEYYPIDWWDSSKNHQSILGIPKYEYKDLQLPEYKNSQLPDVKLKVDISEMKHKHFPKYF